MADKEIRIKNIEGDGYADVVIDIDASGELCITEELCGATQIWLNKQGAKKLYDFIGEWLRVDLKA